MENWLKQHWPELLTFGGIFAVLAVCCAPDMTWINTDSDGIHYVYSAKYLYPAHKTSAPLFLLLGWLFLKVPLGTEFWRFAMLSVVATSISSMLIYLIVKVKLGEKGKLYGIIGALVFGGSALVISQSTIVESYALVTMFGLLAYYFAMKEKWMPCALALGAGLATHHLIGITMIILFVFFKGLRHWKYAGAMLGFLLFYLYIPITAAVNNPPDMWGNLVAGNFLRDNVTTALMLIGGISIWDLPKRILDTLGVVGVSFGLALVPVIYFIIKKKWYYGAKIPWYKEPLTWLVILPIIYYITDLAPQTYVYVMPAVGFGAIAAGIGLSRMRHYWKWAVLGCAVGLLAFNANYLDVGRTLDPKMNAKEYYVVELSKVPDDEVLLAQQGWEWAAVYSYNKENGRSIIPVCIGTLPSPFYQEYLRGEGIELTDYPEARIGEKPSLIAYSIIDLNENTWITKTTDARAYGAEIVAGDKSLVAMPVVTKEPEWAWRPSNPYDIITGAVEVEEWVYIMFSNYSVATFAMLGVIGAVPCWVGWNVIVKKKRWSPRRRNANQS